MSAMDPVVPSGAEPFDPIVEALASRGWHVCDNFLDAEEVRLLAEECRGLWREGEFHRAGIGRGNEFQIEREVRSDHVMWLDPAALSPRQRLYWERLEALRGAVNAGLFLGLFELEAHFAVYPPGSFYARHLDQFRGVEARTLTCVLYLNETWSTADGGQLRMYLEDGETLDVLPTGGTLVTFLSDRFEHEVLPSRGERLSITGWFRTRVSELPPT